MKSTAARIGMVVIALIIVVGAAAGGLAWLFYNQFYFGPPKADYPKPASALEAQRQDIDYFARALALDRSFSPAARREADRRIEALQQSPVALPDQKLHVALMQIVALADNGHSKLRAMLDSRPMMIVPLRVTRFADGFFVMRAKFPYRDMLGGRVQSIDGMPFDQVLKTLETLRGGIESFRAENAAVFIEDQDLLYGSGIAHDPRQSEWTVVTPDGRTVTHMITANSVKGDATIPYGPRWRSPEPLKGMGADWMAYSPARGALPQSLRNIDDYFSRAPVPNSCAEYVRVEDIVDTDGQKIQPFLQDTETALRAHKPCAIIFDLRGNGGGDYTNMWRFTHALPQLTTGRIIVLTDAMTFSAAITTTAFTKEAGGNRVTIIGEPVGDRLAFYAEGGNATLPNSKLSMGYETGKHDYAHACTDWHDCFWLNWLYPVRVNTLQPDVYAPMRFSDWNQGRDIAYERAVALAGMH
ncbi:MAG TPA: hypothetical protein VLT91_01110 [Rhizomicrobium sp.]|nr:hypothetical protein [Rhizomicrobium sp.]